MSERIRYTRIPRPWLTKNRTGRYDAVYDAIERTAVDGDAVEIPLNGHRVKRIRDELRRHLSKRGLWLRSPRFGDTLRVWAEEQRQVSPARGQEARMKRKIVKAVVALVALLALVAPVHAITFAVTGAEVTANYTEPTTNANGSPLTDLGHTNVYYQLPGGQPVRGPNVPASATTGGGAITTTVTVPVLAGQEADVTFFATATDTSLNESAHSIEVVKRIDRLAPGAPK